MPPYQNIINGFHILEVRRGVNRDIDITPPNHGAMRNFREVHLQGPIQQDQNWYHHHVHAFYDSLAVAIINTYDAITDTFAAHVNVTIHHTNYTYG